MSASSAASSSSAGGLYSSEPVPVRDRLEAFHSDFNPTCGAVIETAVASLDPTTLRYGALGPHALVLRGPLVRPAYLRPRRAAFFTAPRAAVAANMAREMLAHDIVEPDRAIGLTRGSRTRACDWYSPHLPPVVRPPSAMDHQRNSLELWDILAIFPRGCAAFYSSAPFAAPGRRAPPPASPADVSEYGPIIVLAALSLPCMRNQVAALDIAKACVLSDFQIAGSSGMRALFFCCYVDLAMERALLEGHVELVPGRVDEGASRTSRGGAEL